MWQNLASEVNFFLYGLLSLVFFGGACWWADSGERLFLFLIFLCILFNQLLLVLLLYFLFKNPSRKKNPWFLSLLFFIKTGLLFGAFYWGVQVMGDRIIIPITLYICELFALGASLYLGRKK